MTKNPKAHCVVCDKNILCVSAYAHVRSQTHKSYTKLYNLSNGTNLTKSVEDTIHIEPDDRSRWLEMIKERNKATVLKQETFTCEACNQSYAVTYRDKHMRSKRHIVNQGIKECEDAKKRV